jgi:hypothetical protein
VIRLSEAVSASSPTPPSFDQFVAVVAGALALDADRLSDTSAVMGEVCRDALDLLVLFGCCDQWLDGFRLPDQMALDRATLGDVHHYLLTYAAHQGSGEPESAPSPADRRTTR